MNCLCGQPLWAPQSIERGFCERCRRLPARYRSAVAGLFPFPYTLPPGYTPPDPRGSSDEPNLYAR